MPISDFFGAGAGAFVMWRFSAIFGLLVPNCPLNISLGSGAAPCLIFGRTICVSLRRLAACPISGHSVILGFGLDLYTRRLESLATCLGYGIALLYIGTDSSPLMSASRSLCAVSLPPRGNPGPCRQRGSRRGVSKCREIA